MKIIHVDDHQLFVEGLRAVLEHQSHGHSVLAASDALAGLELAELHQDADLILVDLSMPGMDGHTLIKALFERNLVMPVVVMSAVEDIWRIKRCLDEGAMGFIPKAASTEAIIAAINNIEAGETCLPEDLARKIDNLPATSPLDTVDKIAASYKISARQMEVLKLMQEGYGNQEIAKVLFLSEHTVKSHARALFQALNVGNRIECVREAERAGLLP